MTLRPRQSVLDLFDPLISSALRVPLPDSPPQTPGCLDEQTNQESKLSEDLMGLFFDHFSERKGSIPSRTQTSGRLVDIEEEVVESEVINIELFQHETCASITKNDLTGGIAASPGVEKMDKPEHIATIMPILVCPDTTIHSEPLILTSQASPLDNEETITSTIGHLNPPQPRDRRRSSIDISRSLSSFSLSVQELPGSNSDLIKEELFPLSVFSEEDSFQSLDEIGTCPFPLQRAQEATILATPHRSTELGKNTRKNTKEFDEEKPETSSNKKEHSPLPIADPNRTEATPNRLKDTSNTQTVDRSLKASYKKPVYAASPQFDIVVPAPRKPKVFTLNRHQSSKPHTSLLSAAKTDGKEDSIPTITSRVLPKPPLEKTRSTGSAPDKTLPRPQKVPIVKHPSALESKIPSRSTATPPESTSQTQTRLGATIKTFGGASRIAVPLKKGVRRTAS